MLKPTMSSQVLATNDMLGARVLAANEVGDVGGGDESNDGSNRVEPKTRKMSKSRKSSKSGKNSSKSGNSPNFGATGSGPSFLTPEARSAFNRLRLAFTKAPILWHFDPECHIRIETDALGYAISGVLSQLASGTRLNKIVTKIDLRQWHPVAFISKKMIPAKTWYETHNSKRLAIIKVFKTWSHYLKDYKYEVFILTDYNNFCRFMDTKSLSSQQVHWAQKLSQYYFWIDYC